MLYIYKYYLLNFYIFDIINIIINIIYYLYKKTIKINKKILNG